MRQAIGPFAQKGLNEPFCLAIGLGRLGPGVDVADGQPPQCLSEWPRTISRTVIGHHPLDGYPLTSEPAQGAQEKPRCGRLALVGQHLDVGQPSGVIDGNMHEIPTCPAISTAPPCACDAVPRPIETPELLYVEMD